IAISHCAQWMRSLVTLLRLNKKRKA
ncbi:N-6 DNA Methylase family protein, partial [Vibrio cholerae HC-50A2]